MTERLNISAEQLAYMTNADPGSGLLFFQNVILPFRDEFPKDRSYTNCSRPSPSRFLMAGKPDKERMGQDMKYVIDSETYEKHIRDEVHLYGLLHQLAFLAGKVKDAEDMANLVETAKHYGEIAEEKFDDWLIPGRYLVFGDRSDLAELKAAELTPLTDVLKDHDAKNKKKQRTVASNDPAYIISGSAFRMLVGNLFDLLAQYGYLRNRVLDVKTERQLARLQKNLSGEPQDVPQVGHPGQHRRYGLRYAGKRHSQDAPDAV